MPTVRQAVQRHRQIGSSEFTSHQSQSTTCGTITVLPEDDDEDDDDDTGAGNGDDDGRDLPLGLLAAGGAVIVGGFAASRSRN